MTFNERVTTLFWPIPVFVVALHAVLFFSLFFISPPLPPISKPKEKVHVRTIQLSKPKPIIQASPKEKIASVEPSPQIIEAEIQKEISKPDPAPEVIKEIAATETPQPKQVEPKKEIPPETTPKPQPKPITKPVDKQPIKQTKPVPKPTAKKETKTPVKTPEKTPLKTPSKPAPKPEIKKDTPKASPATVSPKKSEVDKKKQELLALASGSLSQLNKPSKSSSASSLDDLKLPSNLGELHSETLTFEDVNAASPLERGYKEELASRLKLLLKLPEMGLVKIKLTLTRTGKVAKVEVINAESSVNRKHIEKTLPKLSLPSFGNNFGSESDHTFQITLSNE